MPCELVLGLQWGDEGKGKIIDVLAANADVVVRFQGGANAGHTVIVEDRKYVLHLVPSGILHSGVLCVIGNGMVVDPAGLVQEIESLRAEGVHVGDNLVVSDRAHVVHPLHKSLEKADEERRGANKVGSTLRGIGPCYGDKAMRVGLRMCDLVSDDLRERLERAVSLNNDILEEVYGVAPADVDFLHEELHEHGRRLAPFVKDTVPLLNDMYRSGKRILLEGAQGTMLDINFGTYPYLTSSSTVAGGAVIGTGLPPKAIGRVLGVAKAYCTRVGAGPFPTELDDSTGAMLRERGKEFGATTGRPRRCGWFDAVAVRYAAQINGVDGLVITKLDVLDELDAIKVCVAYELEGKRIECVPADTELLQRCKPVYEERPGWKRALGAVRSFDALPAEATDYLRALEGYVGVPVHMLSLGPERSNLLTRNAQ